MFLANHKKTVYLPREEYRLINAVYELVREGIYHCLYKRYFDSIAYKFQEKNESHWFFYTRQAYYDLAITR